MYIEQFLQLLDILYKNIKLTFNLLLYVKLKKITLGWIMFNILIADDDINICKLTKFYIDKAGYNSFVAYDGESALSVIENNPIDLAIVDVMMPKKDGFTLVKELRQANIELPIILVTALGEIGDKTQGFSVGADDYLTKPVNYDELLLRISALLRRAQITKGKQIIIGDITIDYNSLSIIKNQVSLKLPRKEFLILFKLLSYPNKIFTRSQLFNEFWGINSDSGEDTVKVHINKLRENIAGFDEFEVVTIRGLGYKGVINEKR